MRNVLIIFLNWYKINKTFLFKYLAVGLVGLAIDYFILYSLTEWVGLWYLYSFAVAFIIATANNFFLNKYWTFTERKGLIARQYFFAMVVYIFTFVLSAITMYILTDICHVQYLISKALITVFYTAINFLLFRYWVFAKPT